MSAQSGKSRRTRAKKTRRISPGDDLPQHLLDQLGEEAEVERLERGETQVESKDDKIRWTKDNNKATKALMDLREKYHSRFENPTTTKASLWRKIAAKMVKLGYASATSDICKKKWDNLMSTYKVYKDKSNKTGEGKISWDLFEGMEKIVGKKGSINPDPIQLASSLHLSTKEGPDCGVTNVVKRKKNEPVWLEEYKREKKADQASILEQHKKQEDERLVEYRKIEEKKIATFQEVEDQKLQLLRGILDAMKK